MSPSTLPFRIQVLLSFQNALLDLVTPSLRGVAVKPVGPLIEARFIYEHVSDEERALTSEEETYVVADFLAPVTVNFVAVAVPSGTARALRIGEVWVYLRREEQAGGFWTPPGSNGLYVPKETPESPTADPATRGLEQIDRVVGNPDER